jgi:hydrogenase nickel incorporation protein HypB
MNVKVLSIKEDILGANDENARINRELVDRHKVLMVNITASPGAGKTSVILETIRHLKDRLRIAVVEGDIASTIDADKVAAAGIPAVQINTEGACHLDAHMVRKALDNLDLDNLDLVLIENVGNLICTAEFALGAHKQLVILSVPEGDDKPIKYPLMFANADIILVNKTDVLPYFDFNMNSFIAAVKGLNPAVSVFPVSAKTGEGMDQWFSWLQSMQKQSKTE